MSLLDALSRAGALRPIDFALALSLRRLDPATPDAVLAGAALASLAVSRGHAAFDPARPDWFVDASADADSDAPIVWPDEAAWRDALRASHWVDASAPAGASDPARPLVFEHGLLYLRRYREYERRLADGLRRLAAAPRDAVAGDALVPLFRTLFPNPHDDDQARAAAAALVRPLLLITGGPGTGKTSTIARVLLLLAAQARAAGAAAPRIALAAPTGRAAERMADSLRRALDTLPAHALDQALRAALPQQASTLHRLLGPIPDSPRFRFGGDAPLPVDVVIVDEASMVDLPLMCKLVEAVPDGARLILLGDRDQLPSVEAGDVLAAIDDRADDRAALPAALADWLGVAVPVDDADAAPRAQRVHLRRGYRQARTLDLAPLADAVRRGDADAALALLREGTLAGVAFHPDLADPLQGATRDRLLAPWRELQACESPVEALRLAGHQRLLTALREGPQGARALNARIEESLAGARRAPYFHGRLLLIAENSARHGLFNGDIGVCLRDADGGTDAWFDDGAGGVRRFPPSALPAHDSAFAMTVHKAQGSEFDQVWLLLPRRDARPLSRELLYTALTRAREAVHLCAGDAVLRAALNRRVRRIGGLARRL
jgi:exodeoxyribonuclease V alpha subunit